MKTRLFGYPLLDGSKSASVADTLCFVLAPDDLLLASTVSIVGVNQLNVTVEARCSLSRMAFLLLQ